LTLDLTDQSIYSRNQSVSVDQFMRCSEIYSNIPTIDELLRFLNRSVIASREVSTMLKHFWKLNYNFLSLVNQVETQPPLLSSIKILP
jgi:hypothetical protein